MVCMILLLLGETLKSVLHHSLFKVYRIIIYLLKEITSFFLL